MTVYLIILFSSIWGTDSQVFKMDDMQFCLTQQSHVMKYYERHYGDLDKVFLKIKIDVLCVPTS